jgi:hypothetical protein
MYSQAHQGSSMQYWYKSINNDQTEEVINYNKIMDYLSKDKYNETVWKFRRIVSHQGPLKPGDHDYKDSPYNVMIEWETGQTTAEPLHLIAADDPVTCAIYARDNSLLDKPGWKRFKSLAKRENTFTCMAHQAKLWSFNKAPKYKYGFEVPRNNEHALQFDEKNGNTLWKDAVALELQQISEYQAHSLIQDIIQKPLHLVGTNGSGSTLFLMWSMTEGIGKIGSRGVIPLDSVYSRVVSIRGFLLVLFLAELNKLQL